EVSQRPLKRYCSVRRRRKCCAARACLCSAYLIKLCVFAALREKSFPQSRKDAKEKFKMKRIAVIPGDGIGPEVVREAVRVLRHVQQTNGLELELVDFDWGAEKFLRDGVTLPTGALEMLTAEFDAILAGAFGDPRVPSNKHAEDILLGMRRGLDLYINLRPVRLLNDRLTPLLNRKTTDIDFVVFRENTEGAYVAAGGFLKHGTVDEIALQDEVNTRRGVERIIVAAFEYARANN